MKSIKTVRGRASFYGPIKSRRRPQRAEEAVNMSGRTRPRTTDWVLYQRSKDEGFIFIPRH